MVRLHKSLWSTRHCRTCLLPVIILSVAACSAMTLNAVNSVTPVRQFALGEVMIEQLQAGTRDDACDYAQVLPQILTQTGRWDEGRGGNEDVSTGRSRRWAGL